MQIPVPPELKSTDKNSEEDPGKFKIIIIHSDTNYFFYFSEANNNNNNSNTPMPSPTRDESIVDGTL